MNKQVGSDDEQSHQVARDRAYRRYQDITKQLLTELYNVQGLSTVEIARQLGVSRNLIWEYYGEVWPGTAEARDGRRSQEPKASSG